MISILIVLAKTKKKLIKIITLHYKKCRPEEYYFYLILLYSLIFFKIIDINSKFLSKKDRNHINLIYQNFLYEKKWDVENYVISLLKLDENTFKLKIIIKYCLLIFEDFVPDISKDPNYIKSIWYTIPILTLRKSKMLNFYQDEYFKKLFKEEHEKTMAYYLEKVWWEKLRWEYVEEIINDLNEILENNEIMWRMKIRKKSYFSIYNKLKRKYWDEIVDIIWTRIVFKNLEDLYRFARSFEDNHIFIKKKDYIQLPKENWYKSLHYWYIKPYKNTEILVELQLRTELMDKNIRNNISDLYYSLKKNKWDPMFTEIHKWYEYMLKHLNLVKEK